MKELFVTYEISKLLKDKGFDEKCLAYYSNMEFCGKDSNLAPNDFGGYKYNSAIYENEVISAPTYQQVVDYLRKNHKIIICVFNHVRNPDLYIAHISTIDFDYTSLNYYDAFTETIKKAFTLV